MSCSRAASKRPGGERRGRRGFAGCARGHGDDTRQCGLHGLAEAPLQFAGGGEPVSIGGERRRARPRVTQGTPQLRGHQDTELPAGADDPAVTGEHQVETRRLSRGGQDGGFAGRPGRGGLLIPHPDGPGAAAGQRLAQEARRSPAARDG